VTTTRASFERGFMVEAGREGLERAAGKPDAALVALFYP
jgi:hypothetical protein